MSGALVERSFECIDFWAIAYETQYLRFIGLTNPPQTSSTIVKEVGVLQ